MKRALVIVLAALMLTGCTCNDPCNDPDVSVTAYKRELHVYCENDYVIQGYNIQEAEGGYIVTVEVGAK